jgi:pimeloyl-ACP methyl ester carboxylesterase
MTPCVVGDQPAVCGTLRVREDRSKSAGRQIDLRVAVIPAVSSVPKPDPLVALDGGPGQAATIDLGWTAAVFANIHADRDIVLMDQRGTGGSNRLVAPGSPDVSGLSPAEAVAKIEAWRDQVLASLPGDPRFYTTSVAMDDLDEVRAALGYDRVNLYGPSYGATAAQYYLRQHEDRVRAVVLDGGTLLDVPIFERVAPNSQRALDLLFRRCAADAACHAAYPDLATDFAAVLTRLAARPARTSVGDPWTGEPIVIDQMSFAGTVHAGLLHTQSIGAVPRLIHAAAAGDWDAVARAIAAAMGPASERTDELVMSVVIRCSEGWARFDPAETARRGADSYLGPSQVETAKNLAVACRYAPPGAVTPDDREMVTSDRPVLLVLGEADPQNPPANVADAPTDFPNSLTVVVPGQAHTVAHLGCMPSIVESFIASGTVAGLDVSCAATGVPLPPFDTTP